MAAISASTRAVPDVVGQTQAARVDRDHRRRFECRHGWTTANSLTVVSGKNVISQNPCGPTRSLPQPAP